MGNQHNVGEYAHTYTAYFGFEKPNLIRFGIFMGLQLGIKTSTVKYYPTEVLQYFLYYTPFTR